MGNEVNFHNSNFNCETNEVARAAALVFLIPDPDLKPNNATLLIHTIVKKEKYTFFLLFITKNKKMIPNWPVQTRFLQLGKSTLLLIHMLITIQCE